MSRALLILGFVVAISSAIPAQSPEPPIADTRLTVHTLVREDIFAGFLQGDLTRLARAEKNLETLYANRPGDRPGILAWQGGAALTRAAVANEANQPDQFRQHYRRAQDLFAEAMKLGPRTLACLRLPVAHNSPWPIDCLLRNERRVGSWPYTAYQRLWKLQGPIIEKLPLHHKGEVLSGLAQTAQRTGRSEEAAANLDRILTLMPDTPYAAKARTWKDDPGARANSKLGCQTCHGPGTLAARLAEVSK